MRLDSVERFVERNVDLSKLPRKNNNIDWISSIGYKIPFTYGNLTGELNIIDYDSKKFQVLVEYQSRINKINISNLKGGHISKIVGLYEFMYDVGDTIKDEKRDITILERKETPIKSYRYKCNVCGYICNKSEWITQSSLKNNSGCIVCAGQKIVEHINSVWTTDKWMVDYLGMDQKDAKKYSRASGKNATFICKNCGEKIYKPIQYVYRLKSIACSCSEYTSFGEKVIYKILKAFNIEFIKEYSPLWSNRKRYDFYIPQYKIIIEVHGKQHYEESFKGMSSTPLEEEQQNDIYKRKLAIENGIKEYIEVDARESNIEWIKKSILETNLSNYLTLDNFDWDSCLGYVGIGIIKDVCNYWNNNDVTTKDVITYFNISKSTAIKHLKKGNELGWCSYNPLIEIKKCGSKIGKTKAKKVQVWKDGKYIRTYNSQEELINNSMEHFGLQFSKSKISCVCTGKNKTHKGYVFKFEQDKE